MGTILTTEELARKLRLHPETIRRMAREGEIPSLTAGRQLRFDLENVLEALAHGGRRGEGVRP